MTTNREVNLEFCDFLASKIRSIVTDPVTAERLIPKDQLFGAKRPPFVAGLLRVVTTSRTPRSSRCGRPRSYGSTRPASRPPRGTATTTSSSTRPGSTSAPARSPGWACRAATGLDLSTDWADGPSDFAGLSAHRLPNFFFPGGPHGAGGGNYPRYAQDQVDWITRTLVHARDHGFDVFEPTRAQQEQWMTMIETLAPRSVFSAEHSHYYGANVAGKPRKFLLNPGGRARFHEMLDEMSSTEDFERQPSRRRTRL